MGTPSQEFEKDNVSNTSGEQYRQDVGEATKEPTVTEKSIFKRSTRGATFDNDSLEELYVPIEAYEGRHRYDPKFEWDPKEEKRVVRKVGLRQPPIEQACQNLEPDCCVRLTSRYVPGCA